MAASGVWWGSPRGWSLDTRLVPVSRKALPLLTEGRGPPRASLAIDDTPSPAILPGYCVASAANSPDFTFCIPWQLPSIETSRTLLAFPAAVSAAKAPRPAGSLMV